MVASNRLDQVAAKYPEVGATFKQFWQTPLKEYAATLYQASRGSIDSNLKAALIEEWQLCGLDYTSARKLADGLDQRPVLQTSHHVTPTYGPTFLAIDLISLAGLDHSEIYPVAASSGVAFSNPAWSGAINFGSIPLAELFQTEAPEYQKALKSAADRSNDGKTENRISLISSKQRDQLVFGAQVSTRQREIYDQFSTRLQSLLPPPGLHQAYSTWSCLACANIQQRVFERNRIIIFDANRVISNYLIRVLSQKTSHPLLELLFSADATQAVNRTFQSPPMFLRNYPGKKSIKVEGLLWQNQGTLGEKSGFQEYDREGLRGALQQQLLCPGVFLQFLVLRFLNGIKCLGSFYQTEYLADFRNRWLSLDLNWNLDLKPETGNSLTTGRLLTNDQEIWPLDLAWKGETLDLEMLSRQPMSVFWTPIVKQLAG